MDICTYCARYLIWTLDDICTYCARYLIWILDGYVYILCEVFNMDIGWIYVHIVRGIKYGYWMAIYVHIVRGI